MASSSDACLTKVTATKNKLSDAVFRGSKGACIQACSQSHWKPLCSPGDKPFIPPPPNYARLTTSLCSLLDLISPITDTNLHCHCLGKCKCWTARFFFLGSQPVPAGDGLGFQRIFWSSQAISHPLNVSQWPVDSHRGWWLFIGLSILRVSLWGDSPPLQVLKLPIHRGSLGGDPKSNFRGKLPSSLKLLSVGCAGNSVPNWRQKDQPTSHHHGLQEGRGGSEHSRMTSYSPVKMNSSHIAWFLYTWIRVVKIKLLCI